MRPQQALQVVQLTSAATTGLQQQRSGQQISILQLSGGISPTTIDNQQQIDQQQSADSSVQQQQQKQQTTSDGQLFFHNELFMIQHQADSLEPPQDSPISATTRSESQRSSLEIIAEALNRQQQRRGRRHLSPQPILTPLSTSSVGEMHQSQRSNSDNHDRGEETTKEEEERRQPRQRRLQQDIKKEEGSKDNKKEDNERETTTTKKEEATKRDEKIEKEEGKVKEEEKGRGEEDRRRRRQPSSQPRQWTTTTIMTTTLFLFLFISFSVFIFHLPRPLSESTGSTRERVGATSSSTSNLSDIKQRLVNSIEILLDNNNKVDIDIDNKERQQDNSNMSSADQPSTTAQTAAQASVEPTMVPSSAGTSATSIMPRLNPITIDESTILRQLNNITINMKLRDNMLYQTASSTLLNFYDQFSSVAFLANSTPPNRDDVPMAKHISDFINNMKPAQRTSSTTQATEWYVCLTEEEHQQYQQHQQLMTRPFTHHQQQRPRLHSDSISAINYLIYVASTATATSETILPNVPDDASLFLYSFVLVTTSSSSSSSWVRYNRRAGFQELEPATGATISPTSEWGFNNIVVQGGSSATLSFIREHAFQSQHIVDYNLISSPQQCHVASVIAMVQHPAIRSRLRNWLNQFHHGIYSEFFDNLGNLRNKWLQDTTSTGNIWSQPGATMAASTFGRQDEGTTAAAPPAASATAASASANQPASTTTTLTSGTSITINHLQPSTSFVIKYKRYSDNDNEDVQMDNING